MKEDKELLIFEEFNVGGQTVRSSQYGNVEERILLDRTTLPVKRTISYFDLKGNPIVLRGDEFRPKVTGGTLHGRLCSDFTITTTRDDKRETVLVTEFCLDGSTRATEEWIGSIKSRSIWWKRVDSVGRSWVSTDVYDPAGEHVSTRRVIDDGKQPEFLRNADYVTLARDEKKNWIRKITSEYDPRYPGRLLHQYVDERSIVYHEDTPPR